MGETKIISCNKVLKYRAHLTINAEFYPLADSGRNPVPGDAHVGPHVHPGDLPQLENRPRHLLGWKQSVLSDTQRLKVNMEHFNSENGLFGMLISWLARRVSCPSLLGTLYGTPSDQSWLLVGVILTNLFCYFNLYCPPVFHHRSTNKKLTMDHVVQHLHFNKMVFPTFCPDFIQDKIVREEILL